MSPSEHDRPTPKPSMGDSEARNEAHLQEERFLSKLSVDRSPDPVVWTKEDGRICYVNEAACAAFGYARDAILSLSIFDLDAKLSAEEWPDRWEGLVRRGPMRIGSEIRTGDGTLIPVEIMAHHVADGEREMSVCVVRNLTDRKSAEEALRESEERFREMTELLPEIVFEVDKDLNIRYVNRRGMELFGFSREELEKGLHGFEMLIPADRARARAQFESRLRGDDPGSKEYTGRRRDGTTLPILFHASTIRKGEELVGLRGVIVDLSDQKRTEEALGNIQAGMASESGESFFDSILLNLSRSLGADYALVGRVTGDFGGTVHSISFLSNGRIGDPIEYELAGTPCAQVLGRKACTFPSGVADLFPEDTLLRELGIEAYSGVPLFSSGGRPIGVLLALFKAPLESPSQTESIMEIFASRAGAELERLVQEGQLRSLKQAVESSGEAIFMTDAQGVFTYLNPEFSRLYGFSSDELVGKETPRVLKSGVMDLEEYEALWDTILAGEVYRNELVNKTKGGGSLTVQASVNPIIGDGGELSGFLAIQRDISAQKAAERALRESEERARSVFRVAPIGIGLVCNRVILEANERFGEMVGLSRSELEGQSARILYPSDEEFEWVGREKYRQIRESGEGSVETKWLHKDGRILDVLLSSTPLDPGDLSKGITFTALDITERKRALGALEESERKFRGVVEQSNDAIYILADGKFDLVNRRFCQLTGVTVEEAVHEDFDFLDLVAPESVAGFRDRKLRQERGEPVSDLFAFTILGVDGGRVEVEASVAEIDYRGGRAVLGILRDVSEKKVLEERLRQGQKMESLGRLSGGVAHDLNNLLTPILGYGDLLLKDLEGDAPNRESAEAIVEAGTRARDLVRQLLAIGRRQTLEFTGVGLNELVMGFEKLLRRTVRENIEVDLVLSPSLPPIRADIGQVEQVVMNLAVNAADAMPDGGRLTVKTDLARVDEGYPAEHPELQSGSFVVLEVTDTGPGMDAATVRRVFEPFFTTKKGGTGLGLSTIYGIVKQHGGTVEVESRQGAGSAFRCYFPVWEGSVDHPVVIHDSKSEESGGTETVMVVEDEAAVRSLTEKVLGRLGYAVLSAGDGRDCLALLEGYQGALDLVLTDVVLPGMNGKALFQEIHSRFPNTKVLYMSGYTDEVITHHGVLEEGIALIQKPFSVRQLGAKVREVLDGE